MAAASCRKWDGVTGTNLEAAVVGGGEVVVDLVLHHRGVVDLNVDARVVRGGGGGDSGEVGGGQELLARSR